jgi:hypothetical protein
MDDFRVTVDPRFYAPEQTDSVPHEFVRCISCSVPSIVTSDLARHLPCALAFRPLAPNAPVPVIDCRRGDYPRCGTCQAFLSPFAAVNPGAKSWRCPVCGHLNSTIHFTSLYDMRTNVVDRQELHHLVYDLLPPADWQAIRGQARVFLLVIDENLLCASFAARVAAHVEGIAAVAAPADQIGLITFSGSVTVYDLNHNRSVAFAEFDPLLYIKRADSPFLVNAIVALRGIRIALGARVHDRPPAANPALEEALSWAMWFLDGFGGRLLLFRSDQAMTPCEKLIPRIQQKSISLCLIQETPSALDRCAEVTGGMVFKLGQIRSVAALFSVETAWDACASFRTAPTVKTAAVLGPCSLLSNGATLFPVITSTQSVFYELSTDHPNIGNCHFQLALRFTDDSGIRKVRVINGRMPFRDDIRLPVDEAALAAFLNRKRLLEKEDVMFASRMRLTRRVLPHENLLALFVYNAFFQETGFVIGASIEALVLSNVPSLVVCGAKEFRVIWSPELMLVFPRASDEEERALRVTTRYFGLLDRDIYFSDSEEEFLGMLNRGEAIEAWSQSFLNFR